MPDVLIFDDDPHIGDLVSELIRGKGLTVEHYLTAAGASQIVQEARPKLVILDIMMPGIDGLSACQSIRSNFATRHVKIAILTSKTSRMDIERAKRFGADCFISKPFSAGEFAAAVGKLLSLREDSPRGPAPPPAPPLTVTIFERGAVIDGGPLWVFFDMGAGAGRWLESQYRAPREAWILLSRYEDAAVSEIAAGGALLAAGAQVKLGGPDTPEAHLQRLAPRLSRFGSGGRAMPLLFPQREGEFQISQGVMGACRHTLHPGPAVGYRVDLQGRRVLYCPAHDVDPRTWKSHEADKFRTFFSKASLLIHGFRRSLEDPKVDDGGGTGAWEPVVDMAKESGVRHLVLLPLPGAARTSGLTERVAERAASGGEGFQCTLALGTQRVVL